MMLVGVDFDNTIVCYDPVVHRAAHDRGLIPRALPASKAAVRDYLRRCGQEEAWVELQGYIYGRGMREAVPFPGVSEFFAACVGRGIGTCIISHRTRHPFRGPPDDLHAAAQHWLVSRGFFSDTRIGLAPQRVHFELSKEDKLERIRQIGCDHFIDDLPEFLAEPTFPAGVRRILFDPAGAHGAGGAYVRATSWDDITKLLV